MLRKLFEFLAHCFGGLWASFWNALQDVFGFAKSYASDWMSGMLHFCKDHLPPGLASWLGNVTSFWSTLSPWYGKLNSYFPLSELFVLTGTVLAFVAAIRIIRWVKSFIPTIGD